MRKTIIAISALLLSVLNGAAQHVDTLTALHPEYQSTLPIGQTVPEIEATDTLGHTIRLSDYRGRYLVLDFWATWCGDCRREIPFLKALHNDYRGASVQGKSLEWLSFSFDTKEESWKNILRKEKFPWPQISNLKSTREDQTFKSYQLHWIPAFLIIDPEGKLVSTAITADGLRKNIEALGAKAQSLSKNEAEEKRNEAIADWYDSQRAVSERVCSQSQCEVGGLKMPFSVKVFGEKPSDGRSLWISLHGGGNAPKALNDSQWENQKLLYQPSEGVYVCPRAPWDDWDMWFKNPIDNLYEQLIRAMVVCYDVNPDKVYLMGYSAGGDGVWRMAPRMADHWAAASMMAGHPGDVNMLSLRNLPFMVWCGALDGAYDRNKECQRRGEILDSLQQADPEGYVHSTHIVAGKPHWMDLEDSAALPWMAAYTRNPYPRCVKWVQGDNGRTHFYWIGVPQSETQKGKEIIVSIKGNTIDIEKCDYSQVTFYLNDSLLNLDRPVKVRYNGKVILKQSLHRDGFTLRTTISQRGDPSYCFPAKLTCKIGE